MTARRCTCHYVNNEAEYYRSLAELRPNSTTLPSRIEPNNSPISTWGRMCWHAVGIKIRCLFLWIFKVHCKTSYYILCACGAKYSGPLSSALRVEKYRTAFQVAYILNALWLHSKYSYSILNLVFETVWSYLMENRNGKPHFNAVRIPDCISALR